MANLSIQPSKLEIQIKPGTNYVHSYTIKNLSNQQIILNTSINSWLPQGYDGDVRYQNSSPDFGLSLSNSNLKLGQNFILNPNQSQQLVLKIQIPLNAPEGDRYFTFFVNQEQSASLSTNSTQLIRLGSHLLISVSNSETASPKLKINNFKINNPFVDCFFSTVKFSGEVKNDSDYFNKIDNNISITKGNVVINKLTIFPDNVLAHHSRKIRCLDDKSPIDCQLQRPLWPGIYQASLTNQTVVFIVLPYSLLIFFVFIGLIIKLLVDRHNRRNLYLNQ